MTNVTIHLPTQQAKRLKKVDVGALFQDFVAEYLEHEANNKLRHAVNKSAKVRKLTQLMAGKL